MDMYVFVLVITSVDDNNHSPIHYATEFSRPECAVLLIKRGGAIPDGMYR